MKAKYFVLINFLILSLAGCSKTPPLDYGIDFNTPEFFLARLNSEFTRLTVSEIDYSIEDFGLDMRAGIFAYDNFETISEWNPTTDKHLSYYTLLEATKFGDRYAEMSIYVDGNIKIDYKEPSYKKISFYSSIEASAAERFYQEVKDKINDAIEIEKSSREKARSDGGINRFITKVSSLQLVKFNVRDGAKSTNHYDDGRILSKLKSKLLFEYLASFLNELLIFPIKM